MKNIGVTIFLILILQVSAGAQEGVPEVSKPPLKAMQALASWAGKWRVQMRYSPDNGASWQALPPADHEFSFREKGLVLSEHPLEVNPSAFQSSTYYSYDQYRKTYRVAVMDDTWGIMDIYEGNIEGDKLVLTNLKSGTFFPIGDGAWRGFKLMIDLTGETQRTFIVHKTDDGGQSWQPNFEVIYTK